MAKRPAWGHVSRHCARCNKVGPRVFNPTGPGWVHFYCLAPEEKRERRAPTAKAGSAQ